MYYNLRMVYITTPDKATAKNLGHKILQKTPSSLCKYCGRNGVYVLVGGEDHRR